MGSEDQFIDDINERLDRLEESRKQAERAEAAAELAAAPANDEVSFQPAAYPLVLSDPSSEASVSLSSVEDLSESPRNRCTSESVSRSIDPAVSLPEQSPPRAVQQQPPATRQDEAPRMEQTPELQRQWQLRQPAPRSETSNTSAVAAPMQSNHVFAPRRVVTGIDAQSGKSTIVCDGPPPETLPDGTVQRGLMDFWTTSSLEPHDASVPVERSSDPAQTSAISPPPRGSKFRYWWIEPRPPIRPDDQPRTLEDTRQKFDEAGCGHEFMGSLEHPTFHKTPTIDYVIILKGNVALYLDDGSVTRLGQFDVVVQRSTVHEWVCLDEEPALACAVLIDTPIVGDESYGENAAAALDMRRRMKTLGLGTP